MDELNKASRETGDMAPNQVFVEAIEDVDFDPPGRQAYWAMAGALVPDDHVMVLAFPEKFRTTDRRPNDPSTIPW
jgi:hypothetical protein